MGVSVSRRRLAKSRQASKKTRARTVLDQITRSKSQPDLTMRSRDRLGPKKTRARTRSSRSQPDPAIRLQNPTIRLKLRNLKKTRSQPDLTMTRSKSGVPLRLTIRLTSPNGYEHDLVRERPCTRKPLPPNLKAFTVVWDVTRLFLPLPLLD